MKAQKKTMVHDLALASGFGLVIAAAPVLAQAADDTSTPYLKPDGSSISISGTAVNTSLWQAFTLDYGEGTVLVEMDDWDMDDDSLGIPEGSRVTVYGKIDDDLYEATTIEASSVYVENFGTYFYASSADEEGDVSEYWATPAPVDVGQTVVRGTVTDVNDREFTIDTGVRALTVDTSTMPYNPVDDIGYQRVEEGDYVSVSGNMDYSFWTGRELLADSVVTLID